jgi:hypothetical protein
MQTHILSNPLTATLAVGSGDLLGVMALVIMASLGCWWMVRCNSLEKLMPVVVAVWMLACLFWGIRLGYYFGTNHIKSEQSQPHQTLPQQSQKLPQSSPIESPSAGQKPMTSRQSNAVKTEWSAQPAVSHKAALVEMPKKAQKSYDDTSIKCPSLPTPDFHLSKRTEYLGMMAYLSCDNRMTPNEKS